MSNYGYPYAAGFRPRSSQRFHLAPGQAPPKQVATPEPGPSDTSLSSPQTTTPLESAKTLWFCDACDLELESQQALKSHRKSHVKCTECSFEGAPKIVKAHYQGSHGKFSGSGFKTVTVAVPGCRVQRFRICVGNRPEDIQRWIEDRKKRFPRQQKQPKEEKSQESNPLKAKDKKEELGTMSSLLAGYGSSGSESEGEIGGKEADDNESSKMENLKTDCSGISNNLKSGTPGAAIENPTMPRARRPCRYFLRNGSCLNGEACRFSHEISDQRWRSDDTSMKRKRGGHTTSDTLLRKLLATDMERESSLAMQILEFIVKKDFFDRK